MKKTITLLSLLVAGVTAKADTFYFNTSSSFAAQLTTLQSNAAFGSGDTILLPLNGDLNLATANNTTVDLTGYSNLVIGIRGNDFDINTNGSRLYLSNTSSILLQNSSSSLTVSAGGSAPGLYFGTSTSSTNRQWSSGTQFGPGIFTFQGFASSSIIPLPVSLISFKAITADNHVNITFEVASEKDITYYEVERSTDGKSFTKTGIKATANNTDGQLSYSLQDMNPAAGTNYYRLVINSNNGKAVNSNVAVANMKSIAFEPTIFPNPATAAINLTANAAVNYTVTDMSGRIAQVGTFNANDTKTINITSLNKGNYILNLNSNGQTKAISFVKIAD